MSNQQAVSNQAPDERAVADQLRQANERRDAERKAWLRAQAISLGKTSRR